MKDSLFGMCSFWNVLYWNVLFLECAIFGMCSFWNVLFLECAPFWNVLLLECALFGMCHFQNVLGTGTYKELRVGVEAFTKNHDCCGFFWSEVALLTHKISFLFQKDFSERLT